MTNPDPRPAGMLKSVLSRRSFVQAAGLGGLVAVSGACSSVAGRSSGGQDGGTSDGWAASLTAEPASLDPIIDFSVAGLIAQGHIYDPLVDYLGVDFTKSMRLATSQKVLDSLTWEYKLREGVKFHDGTPLTADDVVFTLLRARDEARSTRQRYVAPIADVVAVDDLTVHIKTSQPFVTLPYSLPFVPIQSRAYFDKVGAKQAGIEPIGTGRYKVRKWDQGANLELVAYEDYFDGQVTPSTLTLRGITEPATRTAELSAGSLQVVTGVPVDLAKPLESDDSVELGVVDGARQVYFLLNTLKGPLTDPRVRQAMNFGVNRDTIVDDILVGYGESRTGPWAPDLPGFNAKAASFYSYDPDRARSLLRAAGADRVRATWQMWSGVTQKDVDIASSIASQLAEVGFDIKVQTTDSARLAEQRGAGQFEMTVSTWSKQADVESILSGLTLQSTSNKFFHNEQFDRLLSHARETLDDKARYALYEQMYQLLVEDPPYLYVHAQSEIYAKAKGLNWTATPFAGNAGNTLFVSAK
ncbi:ABC transporter substrate-binding protein [Kribbella sp. NPDC050820]|uniref:ABC transporter substrate-binding protein n=1 Tax=Kribbella sp. NPDC050820 TaxID=3155408 RepID=UPI00340E5287